MAHEDADAFSPSVPLSLPAWKKWVSTISAFAVGAYFVVSGVWKLSDPLAAGVRMSQALVPTQLALATALFFGISETWAAVLLFVPRWRRWGAAMCGVMLIVFMGYFAINYTTLRGEDCSCSPWLKEEVGPGFFIRDTVLLVLAVLAAIWASRSESLKRAIIALGAIAVFAGVLYGVTAARHSGIKAPDSITVDGQALPLHSGRFLIYFFDPECAHCDAAAKALAKHNWKNVRIIAVSTVNPQWGAAFLKETKLQAGLSPDVQTLRKTFQFVDAPYAVAIEDGRQVEKFPFFDDKEPAATLRKMGWAQ